MQSSLCTSPPVQVFIQRLSEGTVYVRCKVSVDQSVVCDSVPVMMFVSRRSAVPSLVSTCSAMSGSVTVALSVPSTSSSAVTAHHTYCLLYTSDAADE